MNKIKNHSDAVNAVRLLISELHGISIKCTTGKFRQLDGNRVITVGEPGTPDTVECLGGLFLGIEVKFSDDDKLDDDQRRKLNAIEAAGGIAVVADFRHGRDGLQPIRDAIEASRYRMKNIIKTCLDDFSVDVPHGLVDRIAAELHP